MLESYLSYICRAVNMYKYYILRCCVSLFRYSMDSVEDIYRFDPDREHQGLAVVIVNFTTGGEKRDGAELDLNYMKETFERLGFIVECHRDKTKPEMEKLLNDCKYNVYIKD